MPPLEIVCAILEVSDWRSLLTAKLVCITWYHATHSRQLWYNLVKHLTNDSTITKFEGRVQDYTLEELQHWVIKKLRARDAWFNGDVSLFRPQLRILRCPPSICHSQFQLLPGGRWILAWVAKEGLISYDLDTPGMARRVLVHAKTVDFGTSSYVRSKVQFWVNQKEITLSLRMAIWVEEDENKRSLQAYIFKIDVNRHGQNAYLNAKLIAKLSDTKPDSYHWLVTTTDQFLTVTWMTHSVPELSLFRWYGDSLGSKIKQVKLPSLETNYATYEYCVAYEDLIMLNNMGHNYIDVFSVQHIESHDTPQKPVAALYRIRGDRDKRLLPYMMQPFFYQNLHWIIKGHSYEFDIMQLSNSPTTSESDTILNPSVTIRLKDYTRHDLENNGWYTRVSPAATIMLDEFWVISITTYEWDANFNHRVLNRKRFRFDPSRSDPDPFFEQYSLYGLDAGSGRILVNSDVGVCFVFDTVVKMKL